MNVLNLLEHGVWLPQKSGSGILPLQTPRLEAASTLVFLTTALDLVHNEAAPAERIWIPAGLILRRGDVLSQEWHPQDADL